MTNASKLAHSSSIFGQSAHLIMVYNVLFVISILQNNFKYFLNKKLVLKAKKLSMTH